MRLLALQRSRIPINLLIIPHNQELSGLLYHDLQCLSLEHNNPSNLILNLLLPLTHELQLLLDAFVFLTTLGQLGLVDLELDAVGADA